MSILAEVTSQIEEARDQAAEVVEAVHDALTTPVAQGGLIPKDTGRLVMSVKGNGHHDTNAAVESFRSSGLYVAATDSPYYSRINAGSSQQAPLGIEAPATLLAHATIARVIP